MDNRNPQKIEKKQESIISDDDQDSSIVDMYIAKVKYQDALSHYKNQNFSQAAVLFQEAAKLGLPEAQYSLAECYRLGQGLPLHLEKAIQWYTKAAKQNFVDAQYTLGLSYRLGNGVEQNHVQAFHWFLKAAQNEDAPSQAFVGDYYSTDLVGEKNLISAVDWYEKAASKGHLNALYKLAMCYKTGDGIPTGPNPSYSLRLLQKAAGKRHPLACFELANYYKNGEHVEKDLNTAIELYYFASQQGHTDAIYHLGLMYEQGGDGIEKNIELARKYYITAAERGHIKALEKIKDQPSSIIQKMQIHSLLLGIRYKDSLSVLDLKEEKDSSDLQFQAFVKTMLLGYGSTHSAQGSGLFIDAYHREAMDVTPGQASDVRSQRKSKLFEIMNQSAQKSKSHDDAKNASLKPLLVSDTKSIQRSLGPGAFSYFKGFSEINVLGRTFPLMYVQEENWKGMKGIIGHIGHYPTRDAQLWIAANTGHFKQRFFELFSEMNPYITPDTFNTFLTEIPYKPSEAKLEEIKKNVLNLLAAVKEQAYSGQQFFYMKLFSNLIEHLAIDDIKGEKQTEQAQLAFSRLEYILNKGMENINNYELFIIYIEHAFDEIIFLNALSEKYKKEDIRQLLTDFIQEQYMLEKKDIPAHIALGGSGIHLLSNTISKALEEVEDNKEFKNGRLYIQNQAYFEIPIILGYKFGKRIPTVSSKDICILFDSKTQTVEEYSQNALMDVMVCAFQENVSFLTDKFGSKDIHKLIDEQLQLRDKINSDKRLIVIIDTTINAFDDQQMSLLLIRYEEEIRSGKLAIMTVHSLNKYFHMGFDKMPAGFSSGFYNKDLYPKIAEFYETEWLGGYLEDEPTPQMIAHLVKYATPQIIEFNNIIKGNSRYIHEELLPKELLDASKQKFVSVYCPYTSDIYQDIWGFLTFKIDDKGDLKELSELVRNNIKIILELINVKSRDGYGYIKTTSSTINQNTAAGLIEIFRLSIGTESPQELKNMLAPLFNYLYEVNETIELYAKRMPYQCKEELMTIAEKTIRQLKKIKNEHKEEKIKIQLAEQEINMENKEKKAVLADTFESLLYAAGNLNHPEAQYKVAEYYKTGKHVKKDITEAFAWYQIAAKQNHINSILTLATSYETGFPIKKDLARALRFYSQAAELGNVIAINKLAEWYTKGIGVAQDLEKAVKFYRLASEKDNLHAKIKLGLCYQKGLGVEANSKKAMELFHEAEKIYLNNSEYKEHALFNLAISYEKGKIFPKDEKRAVELYQQAAIDHVEAQYRLGLCYESDNGISRDPEQAVKWFEKAAQNDHADACLKLATCYEQGTGIRKDTEKALHFYHKANELGNNQAKAHLDNLRNDHFSKP